MKGRVGQEPYPILRCLSINESLDRTRSGIYHRGLWIIRPFTTLDSRSMTLAAVPAETAQQDAH